MSQINFRVQGYIEKFLALRAKLENKSKTAVANEIFLKGLNELMFPYLAKLYQEGKISIKKISEITNQHFSQIMDEIPKFIKDIKEDDELLQYSEKIEEIFEPFIQNAKQQNISFDKGMLIE
ncbi:MAG: hypothetical protein ACTSVU_00615 [Promethearchaeota archaeon]